MHRTTVKQFMVISFAYAAFSAGLTYFVHPKGAGFMMSMVNTSEGHWVNLWRYMPFICLAVLAAFVLTRAFLDREKMTDMGLAFLGCVLFMWGFSMFKSTMPYVVPYWADPMFMEIDRALHLGHDPWSLIEGLRAPLGTEIVDYIYLKLWAWPAIVGPMFLVVFDGDRARVARFFTLFLFTWIFLGNVLAMTFMSAGPVFYDRLLGTDEFPALMAVLASPSETSSLMGIMREWLWVVNMEGYEGVSSGISAFPSLHVGVATLACLYLWERSRLLAPIGLGFLGFILLGSVLSGLHYAVDGYVSIVVVVLAWAVLRRKSAGIAATASDGAKAQIA